MSDYDYQQAYILTDRVTKAPVGFFGRDGKEYLINFGSGGSGTVIDGEVDTYALLPSAAAHAGEVYLVKQSTGIWLINRKSGGLYICDGITWSIIIDYDTLVTQINSKFDIPTGDTTQYLMGDGVPAAFPVAGQAGTLVRQVRNVSGVTITKGSVVYISGASGNKPTIALAVGSSAALSDRTYGLVQADIATNTNGYVVVSGDLSGLNTSAYADGALVYLSDVTAGAITATEPVAPMHSVFVGVVTRAHATQGQIDVSIQNGYEIDDLHNVMVTSVAAGDVLFYNSISGLWENKAPEMSDIAGLDVALNDKQPIDDDLSAIAALTGTGYAKRTGTNTWILDTPSSGGNSLTVTLAFGATFTDKAQTVVTGQSWVTSTSDIIAQVLTPTGADPDELYLLDLKPVISDLVAGVGFTITLYSMPQARGNYSVMCIGV